MRVGRCTERVRTATEHLGRGTQLRVHLKSDHHLPSVGQRHEDSRASSSTRPAAKSCASLRPGPSSCTPTGRPASPVPKGTETAGSPARLVGIVKTSERYIASGLLVFSPNLKATDGAVAPRRRSTLSYARS